MKELVTVDPESIPEIMAGCTEEEIAASVLLGWQSATLRAGYLNGEFLFLYGFIAPTLLSDIAYLWVNTSPAVARHKVVFGRWAKMLMWESFSIFPQIVGHCDANSAKWLASLGATFSSAPQGYTKFELRRP